jgi:hypothetical protein
MDGRLPFMKEWINGFFIKEFFDKEINKIVYNIWVNTCTKCNYSNYHCECIIKKDPY